MFTGNLPVQPSPWGGSVDRPGSGVRLSAERCSPRLPALLLPPAPHARMPRSAETPEVRSVEPAALTRTRSSGD